VRRDVYNSRSCSANMCPRPERWLGNVSEKATAVPGVLQGVLSFSTGPQSCIGYRFALVEFVVHPHAPHVHVLNLIRRMKALLFHLIPKFKIELAVPLEDVDARTSIVLRPMLRSTKENALPVKLTAL
jgi:hypothetical protein